MCFWIVASQDRALISTSSSVFRTKSISLCSRLSPTGRPGIDCHPRGPCNVMQNADTINPNTSLKTTKNGWAKETKKAGNLFEATNTPCQDILQNQPATIYMCAIEIICVYVLAHGHFAKEAQWHIGNRIKIPEHKAESTSAQPSETSMEAFAEVKYHVQKRRICHHAKLNNLINLNWRSRIFLSHSKKNHYGSKRTIQLQWKGLKQDG